MVLIVIGVVGIILSAILTRQKFNRSGLPSQLLEHTAGTGLVPSWVSFLNIASWVILAIGILLLIF